MRFESPIAMLDAAMTKTKQKMILNNKGRLIPSSLPPDMEVFVLQVLDEWVDVEMPDELLVREISLNDLPMVELKMSTCDDRGEAYARKMVGEVDIPPLVCADGILIDGRHRLFAARLEGKSSLPVIDLSEWICAKDIPTGYVLGAINISDELPAPARKPRPR